jgi:hypothetical protein
MGIENNITKARAEFKPRMLENSSERRESWCFPSEELEKSNL